MASNGPLTLSVLKYIFQLMNKRRTFSMLRKESYHLGVKFLENFNQAASMTDGQTVALEKNISVCQFFYANLKKSYYGLFLANKRFIV